MGAGGYCAPPIRIREEGGEGTTSPRGGGGEKGTTSPRGGAKSPRGNAPKSPRYNQMSQEEREERRQFGRTPPPEGTYGLGVPSSYHGERRKSCPPKATVSPVDVSCCCCGGGGGGG